MSARRKRTVGRRAVPSKKTTSARVRPTRYCMQVARALKALREARKLSIEQLAERAHIPAVRISKLETAELSPRIRELGALARVFRMLPSTILRRAADVTNWAPKRTPRTYRPARRT